MATKASRPCPLPWRRKKPHWWALLFARNSVAVARKTADSWPGDREYDQFVADRPANIDSVGGVFWKTADTPDPCSPSLVFIKALRSV